jgi:thiamine biosynthesis lipoprotein
MNCPAASAGYQEFRIQESGEDGLVRFQRRRQGMNKMDRRDFLQRSGLLGLGVATATMLPLRAEALSFDKRRVKVSQTKLAMGTFVSMTILHSSKDQAEEAMALAFEEVQRLEQLLSRYDKTTPVYQLNREGVLKDVSPEMDDVMKHSLRFHEITHGYFDVTVKPAVDLFKETVFEQKSEPTEQQLKEVLSLINARNISYQDKTIRFKKEGMGVTFDGIAKGYIVDRAADILSARGIENYLINAGGDIRTKGSKQGKQPWVVAIEDPGKRHEYPDVIQMRDGAIATSGNYEVYFDKEKLFHHIVNPMTGVSPCSSVSVSVSANTTMEADALATSVFVMNPREGTELINSIPDCSSLVVAKEGSLLKSNRWKSLAI